MEQDFLETEAHLAATASAGRRSRFLRASFSALYPDLETVVMEVVMEMVMVVVKVMKV